MNAFEKNCVSFLSSKQRPKKGRKHLAAANLIVVKILFFLVSQHEHDLGELCMHFELQVGSPWTNLDEIWPNCCQIGYLQNFVCEF